MLYYRMGLGMLACEEEETVFVACWPLYAFDEEKETRIMKDSNC